MADSKSDLTTSLDLQELDIDEAKRVGGGFNWQAAAFCGACAIETGPVGMAAAFVAGGILLD